MRRFQATQPRARLDVGNKPQLHTLLTHIVDVHQCFPVLG